MESESQFSAVQRTPDTDAIVFECNICNAINETKLGLLERDTPTCTGCGSCVRFRGIIQALTTELFGRSVNISQIKPRHPEIRGYGLSCWSGYASRLRRKVDFKNTFLHQKPRLDITNLDGAEEGKLDFLIASDVFEHVAPPVDRAFINARKLLKDDGVLIISVPFTNPGTWNIPIQEHYPDLFNFEIKRDSGAFVLENTTRNGVKQIYHDLNFHGGPGSTLEMRIFSESSLISCLHDAGFAKVTLFSGPDLAHGIHWPNKCSVPLAARVKEGVPRYVDAPPQHRNGPSLPLKLAFLRDRILEELHAPGATRGDDNRRDR